jgi:serine/threonine protein kinase
LGKVIGKGAFSAVRLGSLRDGSQRAALYAVKVAPVSCSTVMEYKNIASIVNEIDALGKLHLHEHVHGSDPRGQYQHERECEPNGGGGGHRWGAKHVVSMKAAAYELGFCFIVLEYLSGGTLLHWLLHQHQQHASGHAEVAPVSELLMCRLLRDLAAALVHCHSLGFMHRDIKPENVIMTSLAPWPHSIVKLADFGLAKRITPEAPEVRQYCGTPEFIAPEVVGHDWYTYPADVWSFGVMSYLLLCGEVPFTMVDDATGVRITTVGEYLPVLRRGLVPSHFAPGRWNPQLHPDAMDFVRCLLVPDEPESRGGGSMAALLHHPWFEIAAADQQQQQQQQQQHGRGSMYRSDAPFPDGVIGKLRQRYYKRKGENVPIEHQHQQHQHQHQQQHQQHQQHQQGASPSVAAATAAGGTGSVPAREEEAWC